MNEQEFKHKAQTEYDRIFSLIYPEESKKADLQIRVLETPQTSGYLMKTDVLVLNCDMTALDETDNVYLDIWPSWKTELIHEMIHEFQYKIDPPVSQTGTELFNLYQVTSEIAKSHNGNRGFGGPGHNDVFYTSLAILADAMGVTGQELKNRI